MTENLTDTAMKVLKFRYLIEGETPFDMFRRVAKNISKVEKKNNQKVWYDRFYDMMRNLEFLPNTPCLINAGRYTNQLSACFVIPVGDSIEEIFDSIKAAAQVHKTGGGTGFDFSPLRPNGSTVTETRGIASGPVSFMRVFNAATNEMKQGGVRRGANMGILRVDHPDILEFLDCKKHEGDFTNFNISVAVTDKFMNAVIKDEKYWLHHCAAPDEKIQIRARKVWDVICQRIWTNGEPGIIFMDTVNDKNPLAAVETIVATNPCAEQPLPAWGSCTLGSINLSKCVHNGNLDEIKFRRLIRYSVRFLDNVVSATSYPLPEIKKEAIHTRRIGLGIMGLADLFILMKVRYGSKESLKIVDRIGLILKRESYKYSRKLLKEKGVSSISAITDRRNGVLTTIAPTGSLSMIAGCSSGCEPVFSFEYSKICIEDNLLVEHPLSPKDGEKEDYFVTARDVSIDEHIKMQAVLQVHIDSGISKTINADEHTTVDQIHEALIRCWQTGCKSVTLYREGSRVLESQVDTTKTTKLKAPEGRPQSVHGTTSKVKTGRGKLYVTVNEKDGKPFEVFLNIGKSGKEDTAYSEAIGRLISLSLRSGVHVEKIVEHLQFISGDDVTFDLKQSIRSVPDAIATVLKTLYSIQDTPQKTKGMDCPDCGSSNIRIEEGCVNCIDCGWSKCN